MKKKMREREKRELPRALILFTKKKKRPLTVYTNGLYSLTNQVKYHTPNISDYNKGRKEKNQKL